MEKGKVIKCGKIKELSIPSPVGNDFETIRINMISGTSPDSWIDKIEELLGVKKVVQEKNNAFSVVIEKTSSDTLLRFIADNDLPFASITRVEHSASLEQIFISNTSGEIQ